MELTVPNKILPKLLSVWYQYTLSPTLNSLVNNEPVPETTVLPKEQDIVPVL